MKTIWKFPLVITDLQLISMPEGANILTAQMQNGNLYLWAEVDTERVRSVRTIEVLGTGSPIRDSVVAHKYINSVQDGPFVWHIFDGISE